MSYDLTNPLKPTIIKDPDALLDYSIDLTEWLDDVGDLLLADINQLSFVEVGVEVDRATVTPDLKKIVIWVKGGEARKPASATVHFKTDGGRIDDRTIYFKMTER